MFLNLLDLTNNIKNYLSYKYLLIIDGDNNMNKLIIILNRLKELDNTHIIIFLSNNSAKNKNIEKLQDIKFISIVNTKLDGKNNGDIAISIFCGQISLFPQSPIIGILTEDHFGPNLAKLLNNIKINTIYISYYDLIDIDSEQRLIKIFNNDQPSIRKQWRTKWLQSGKRFSELYKIDSVEFIKWFQGAENEYIEKIVISFLKEEIFREKLEEVDMSDEELILFYKNNWKDTQAEFCRQYGFINPKNFSRWLMNKNPQSNVSRNAVLKYAHEFSI